MNSRFLDDTPLRCSDNFWLTYTDGEKDKPYHTYACIVYTLQIVYNYSHINFPRQAETALKITRPLESVTWGHLYNMLNILLYFFCLIFIVFFIIIFIHTHTHTSCGSVQQFNLEDNGQRKRDEVSHSDVL